MTDRQRRLAAASVPSDSLIFFGANPCHSPALEAGNVDAAGRPVSCHPARCPRCGGADKDRYGRVTPHLPPEADPVRDYAVHVGTAGGKGGATREAPLTAVCGLCNRSAYDGQLAMAKATKPDDGQPRDGFENLATPDRDAAHRTDAAVDGAAPDERPLTRKARRALRYGRTPPGPAPED